MLEDLLLYILWEVIVFSHAACYTTPRVRMCASILGVPGWSRCPQEGQVVRRSGISVRRVAYCDEGSKLVAAAAAKATRLAKHVFVGGGGGSWRSGGRAVAMRLCRRRPEAVGLCEAAGCVA